MLGNPPKGRILCTEDDEDTRDLLSLTLSHFGYAVVVTGSTDEAIDLAKHQHFDLYLVDNWMPELSGVQLTKKLRKFDIKTPVLFYSGAGFDSDKEDAFRSGAQGYFVKPVTTRSLIDEVTRIIAESKIAVPVAIAAVDAE